MIGRLVVPPSVCATPVPLHLPKEQWQHAAMHTHACHEAYYRVESFIHALHYAEEFLLQKPDFANSVMQPGCFAQALREIDRFFGWIHNLIVADPASVTVEAIIQGLEPWTTTPEVEIALMLYYLPQKARLADVRMLAEVFPVGALRKPETMTLLDCNHVETVEALPLAA